jgi:ABC-type multidrug transport system fused ATPase/permease subunit
VHAWLQISDSKFSTVAFDFEGAFSSSMLATNLDAISAREKRGGLHALLQDHETKERTEYADMPPYVASSRHSPPWRQFWTLLRREFTLAARDPSLYYLQLVLVTFYGFLIGAAFFTLVPKADETIEYIPAGVLWILLMNGYIPVFKVYHLSRANKRFTHERSNNSYGVFVYWLSELLATALLVAVFIPGSVIAYFMMNLPRQAYPFCLLLFWLTSLTSETMLAFITKFSNNATTSIIVSQGALVILTVFGGGQFIEWNKTPDYWLWLQELSLFTQASRAGIIEVLSYIDYSCTLSSSGYCYAPTGQSLPCDASAASQGHCKVKGRTVLYELQGVGGNDSHWKYFAFLVLIFAVLRLGCLFLMYVPVERLRFLTRQMLWGRVDNALLEVHFKLRRVEGRLLAFMHDVRSHDERHKAAMKIQHSFLSRAPLSGDSDSPQRRSGQAHGCLTWANLNVILKKNKQKLIDDVSGRVVSGRVLALMGPSGAGKVRDM